MSHVRVIFKTTKTSNVAILEKARYRIIFLCLLFFLALATRCYNLQSTPYFPQAFPWCGRNPKGLYVDEVNYLKAAKGLPQNFSLYPPPIFLFFIKLSVKAGGSPYAARFPSALASSLSAILVYLISEKIQQRKHVIYLGFIFHNNDSCFRL